MSAIPGLSEDTPSSKVNHIQPLTCLLSLTDAAVVANAKGQRREVAKLKDAAVDLKEQDEKEMKIPMIPLPSYLVVTV